MRESAMSPRQCESAGSEGLDQSKSLHDPLATALCNLRSMRTTLVIDDRVGKAARAQARFEQRSLSALVSSALEEYLARRLPPAEAPPFKLVTVGGTGLCPGVNVGLTSELLVAEDETAHEPADKEL